MTSDQKDAESPEYYQVRSSETVRVTSFEVKVGDSVWDDQVLLIMETENEKELGFLSCVYGIVTEIPVETGVWISPGKVLIKIEIVPSPFDDNQRFPR